MIILFPSFSSLFLSSFKYRLSSETLHKPFPLHGDIFVFVLKRFLDFFLQISVMVGFITARLEALNSNSLTDRSC